MLGSPCATFHSKWRFAGFLFVFPCQFGSLFFSVSPRSPCLSLPGGAKGEGTGLRAQRAENKLGMAQTGGQSRPGRYVSLAHPKRDDR